MEMDWYWIEAVGGSERSAALGARKPEKETDPGSCKHHVLSLPSWEARTREFCAGRCHLRPLVQRQDYQFWEMGNGGRRQAGSRIGRAYGHGGRGNPYPGRVGDPDLRHHDA
jgi:hypothetical protein